MRRACHWAAWCATPLFALTTFAQAASLAVVVVDKDGKPAPDAVVIVTPAARTTTTRTLPATATIAQEKMQFVPAVTLVRTGAKLTLVNNDTWDHHVRGSEAGLMQFTAGQAGGFELRLDGRVEGKPPRSAEVTVDKPGPVLLGCHIHGSMRGHVYVSDSPWALKTNAEGVAQFDDLPDGAAVIRVWHADQLIDLPARTMQLTAAPQKAEMRLQVSPRRRRI